MTKQFRQTSSSKAVKSALDIDIEMRHKLAQFVVGKLTKAKLEGDTEKFIAYMVLADLLAEDNTGIMIAKLFNDIECLPVREQADITEQVTAKIKTTMN